MHLQLLIVLLGVTSLFVVGAQDDTVTNVTDVSTQSGDSASNVTNPVAVTTPAAVATTTASGGADAENDVSTAADIPANSTTSASAEGAKVPVMWIMPAVMVAIIVKQVPFFNRL